MTFLRTYGNALALVGVSLLAIILRCVRLDQPVWGDEVASWAFARRTPFVEMWQYATHDASPPLYYALLHLSLPLFGPSPVGLRIPSLVCGVLLVPVSYAIGRESGLCFRRALAATLLVACSSSLIYYSQEARSYALLALLSALATWLLIREINAPGRVYRIGYGLVILALLQTHYYSLFLLWAHGMCLMFYRRFRMLLVAGALGVVIISLTAMRILNGELSYGPSGQKTDWIAFESLTTSFSIGTLGWQRLTSIANSQGLAFPNPVINNLLLAAGWFVSLSCFMLLGFRLQKLDVHQRRATVLLLVCTLIPSGLALLAGSPLAPHPQWLLRGLIAIWVFFPLLLVIAWHRVPLPVLLSTMIALNIGGLYPYYTSYVRFGDQLIFEQLRQMSSQRDLIVADPAYMAYFVEYYLQAQVPIVGYSSNDGWIDIARMKASNEFKVFTLETAPAVAGDIYVFYRADQLRWTHAYPDKRIYVYNQPTRSWQLYPPNQEGG